MPRQFLEKSALQRMDVQSNLFRLLIKQLKSVDAASAAGAYLACDPGHAHEAASRTEEPENRTALHHAAMAGRNEALQIILDALSKEGPQRASQVQARTRPESDQIPPTASCVNKIDAHGDSALIQAARGGHLECARLLLNCGADPNLSTLSGYTAMHSAALSDEREVLELLLQHDADPFQLTFNGHSPRELAKRAGHLRTEKWLLWAEADYRKRHPNRTVRVRRKAIECSCSFCSVLRSKHGNRDDPSVAVVGIHRVLAVSGHTVRNDPRAAYLSGEALRRVTKS